MVRPTRATTEPAYPRSLRQVNAFSQIAFGILLVSMLAAAAAHIMMSPEEHRLLRWSVSAGILAAALAWRCRPAPAYVAATGPLFPLLALVVLGRSHFSDVTPWLVAMLTACSLAVLRRRASTPMSPLLEVSLGCWALAVALTWPIIALREGDFSYLALFDTKLATTSRGISAATATHWISSVALLHGVGLTWLRYLWAEYGVPDANRQFTREVVKPAGIVLALALCLSLYQGYVDPYFLSWSMWPGMGRAAGPLLDANASGMLAALWAPFFLVLLVAGRHPAGRIGWGVSFAIAVGAVWSSASRTAVLALVLALALYGSGVLRSAWSGHFAPRKLAALGGAAALLLTLLIVAPRSGASAVDRAVASMRAGPESLAELFWRRDGYGSAAVVMIRDFPLAGVGIGAFHSLVMDYGSPFAPLPLPPDNAQSWYRHQLAELGLAGSAGWLLWCCLLVGLAISAIRREPSMMFHAAAGALAGLALASLVGMPAQHPVVALTIWTMAFALMFEARGGESTPRGTRGQAIVALICLCGALLAPILTFAAARGDLRVPFRAARFDFNYTYGFYFDPGVTWSGEHGVTVPPAPKPWMKLTYWVSHPDADQDPVRVEIWRGREQIADRRLRRDQRVVQYVQVPGGNKRFVLEVRVDRTWRPSDYGQKDPRELGLGMRWEFVDVPPAAAG